MNWNHRVCKETHTLANGSKTIAYEIREVHYNTDGQVCLVTENGIAASAAIEEFGNSTEAEVLTELNETIDRMKLCLTNPVLDIDTIKYAEVK